MKKQKKDTFVNVTTIYSEHDVKVFVDGIASPIVYFNNVVGKKELYSWFNPRQISDSLLNSLESLL